MTRTADHFAAPPDRSRALWGDRGVRTKIQAAVGVAGVVATAVGFMGLTAVGNSPDTSHTLYVSNIAGITAADDMMVTIGEARRLIRDVIITPDQATAQQSLQSFQALEDTFHQQVAAYGKSFPTEEKLALVTDASKAFDQYISVGTSVLGPLGLENDVPGFYTANQAQAVPVAKQATDALTQVREIESTEAGAAAAAAQDQYESQRSLALML